VVDVERAPLRVDAVALSTRRAVVSLLESHRTMLRPHRAALLVVTTAMTAMTAMTAIAACGHDGSNITGVAGRFTPPVAVVPVPWVDGAWVQPIPSWGSPVRLALPVPLDSIVLGAAGGLGFFGAHEGGHVEGLDHVWIPIKPGTVVGSWADGTVLDVQLIDGAYYIDIDYGHGDYLEPAVQTALIGRVMNEVVGPYFTRGAVAGNSRPWEPTLTNKLLFHHEYPGTFQGEWLCINKGWTTPDASYFDVIAIRDVTNAYGHFRHIDLEDYNTSAPGSKGPTDGTCGAKDEKYRRRIQRQRDHIRVLTQRAPPSQDCGSNPNTRSSCAHRQAFAMRAAHATASSREGSSSTVKPPSSGGPQG